VAASFKELKKERAGVLINFWWSMWKERNLRTFENKENSAQQLAAKIVDSIKLFRTSCLIMFFPCLLRLLLDAVANLVVPQFYSAWSVASLCF
jgi:hypothetical protein